MSDACTRKFFSFDYVIHNLFLFKCFFEALETEKCLHLSHTITVVSSCCFFIVIIVMCLYTPSSRLFIVFLVGNALNGTFMTVLGQDVAHLKEENF